MPHNIAIVSWPQITLTSLDFTLCIRTLKCERNLTRNVGQCPTWWPPCLLQVAPSVQRRSLADAHIRVPCSNAAKTRNPLKLAGVPQTRQQISAVSRPKFAILWGHVEEILLLNIFFPIVDTCLSCEDTARQSCAMVPKWRFFCVLYLQRAACRTFQTCILNSH